MQYCTASVPQARRHDPRHGSSSACRTRAARTDIVECRERPKSRSSHLRRRILRRRRHHCRMAAQHRVLPRRRRLDPQAKNTPEEQRAPSLVPAPGKRNTVLKAGQSWPTRSRHSHRNNGGRIVRWFTSVRPYCNILRQQHTVCSCLLSAACQRFSSSTAAFR